jgi:tRNA (guanine9-N1)-methyltransferase
MNDAGYKRWTNTEWWHDGYERLWVEEKAVGDGEGKRDDGEEDGTQAMGRSEAVREDIKPTVVYLTADSDEELAELKDTEIYIIGGICDHNRYKVE